MRHKISFSQFGEDIAIANLLRTLKTGFYIDVGAHHPFALSNTALFHMQGWNGINVEPSRSNFLSFKRMRPNAINLNVAIHNTKKEVVLHTFKGGRVNTIVDSIAEHQKQNKEFVESTTVSAMSLNELCEEYLPPNTAIDLLSLDIEGYDFEAIDAFDLSKYKPKVMCIENHGFNFLELSESRLVKKVLSEGYCIYSINVFSFVFLSLEFRRQLKKQ